MLIFMKKKTFGKLFVTLYVTFWLIVVACSWIYWKELNFFLKALIVVLEIILIPDIQAIKDAFRAEN